MASRSINYWIVGAAKSGSEDHYDDFVRDGYWKLFWAKGEQPAQEVKRLKMRPGDWIAIKKMVGGPYSQGKIRVRALGVIEEVSRVERSVQVKWLSTGLNQIVDGHGLYSSIHGPFTDDSVIVRGVFHGIVEAEKFRNNGTSVASDLTELFRHRHLDETTRQALIDARVGQGKFRSDVLKLWGHRCAVTGSQTGEAIRASHIKPWCKSTNDERLNPSNGLPLIANLDALFDAGLISFSDSGSLIVSSKINDSERAIHGLVQLKLRKKPPKSSIPYFLYHRTSVFCE